MPAAQEKWKIETKLLPKPLTMEASISELAEWKRALYVALSMRPKQGSPGQCETSSRFSSNLAKNWVVSNKISGPSCDLIDGDQSYFDTVRRIKDLIKTNNLIYLC